MSYPWYTVRRLAGPGQLAAVSIDEHCHTKRLRFRLEVVLSSHQRLRLLADTPTTLASRTAAEPQWAALDVRVHAHVADVLRRADRLTVLS
ncbi:MAG: hypothetical protein M0Z54_09035 [Thermaerobacter sp.]|nr:hypothetical protein [Thermaerobacter sp.]